MKIAVMGYGTIGSGVVDVLRINKEKITKRAGEPVDVKYILDLREFPGDPMEDAIVHDYQTIVNDPEIGIVVETMGGVEPAYTFVKAMLEAGKQVATSNKNLVAAKGAELIKIARDHNVNFQFEASVGGGIPIIRPLNKCLTADEIEEITGILNGTTNYMLTKMAEEGADFDEVLKDAQEILQIGQILGLRQPCFVFLRLAINQAGAEQQRQRPTAGFIGIAMYNVFVAVAGIDIA